MISAFLGLMDTRSISVESEMDSLSNTDMLRRDLAKMRERLRDSREHERALARQNSLLRADVDQLFETLNEKRRQLQASQKAQLIESEKTRRLSELLEIAKETATITAEENKILTVNIARLQTGIHTLTDGDIKQQMTVLYHELEQWIARNFGSPSPDTTGDRSAMRENRLVEEIQSELSTMIHRSFWTCAFVGCGVHCEPYMTKMANLISKECPKHVSQHWRYAMSIGAIQMDMMETSKLDSECDYVTQWARNIGNTALAERSSQMAQLKELLWKCIRLKHEIEYQESGYLFWISVPGVPFRGETMRDPLMDDATNAVVQWSLWPALRKVTEPGKWETIVKEVVRTAPSQGLLVLNGPPGVQEQNQDPEL